MDDDLNDVLALMIDAAEAEDHELLDALAEALEDELANDDEEGLGDPDSEEMAAARQRVDAGMMEWVRARMKDPARLSEDAQGHEHSAADGRFVGKGKGKGAQADVHPSLKGLGKRRDWDRTAPTTPAAKPAAQSAPATDQSALAKAFGELESKHYGLVPLADLAEATGWDRDRLHAVVLALRQEGILSLQSFEGRYGSPEEKKRLLGASIRENDDEQPLAYVAIREGAEERFKALLSARLGADERTAEGHEHDTPESALSLVDAVLAQGLAPALAVSDEVRAKVRALAKKNYPHLS